MRRHRRRPQGAQHTPELTSLSLACCNKVTDEGLKELGNVPLLISLDLEGCHDITRRGP